MEKLKELENKIRQAIPELKEISKTGINRITPIMLNHVLVYSCNVKKYLSVYWDGDILRLSESVGYWNLKSAYLKDQSYELIKSLNELN